MQLKNKTSTGQPADPLLGAAVSNTHFALWTAKMYQVYTNKGMNDLIRRKLSNFSLR